MLKKLKGIFVVQDESSGQKAPSDSPAKAPKTNAKQESTKVSPKASSSNSKPDEKFVNLLFKAIEENNVEGFDYIEFMHSVKSLKKVEASESQRFRNAFAMANGMGLTKNKLFSTAKHYVKVLDTEEKKFAQAFESQRTKQVQERKNKSQSLEESIAAKEAQIKQLQAEIEAERKQLASIEGEITKSMAKVEATKEGFYAAYNMVLTQIKTDLDKITEYIE